LKLESYKRAIQDYTGPLRTPSELKHLSLTPNWLVLLHLGNDMRKLLMVCVCVENGSLPPLFIASRDRFRDYIRKEPACNRHGGITRGLHVAVGGERRRVGLVRPHPSGTSPQSSFAYRLQVGPGLRLRGWLAHIFW
jgi:hypothetical protein